MSGASPKRRYRRNHGDKLRDGFTLRLPSRLDAELRRLARVLGVSMGDFATRAIESAVERECEDLEVVAAIDSLRRIDERKVSDAPLLLNSLGGEAGEGATAAPAAERLSSSAPSGTPESKARAPAAEAVPDSAASPPAQSLTQDQRDAIGRRMFGALKLAKLTTRQAAEEMSLLPATFEGLMAGSPAYGAGDYLAALDWAGSKLQAEGAA